MTGAVKVTCKLMWLEKLLAEISPGSLSKKKKNACCAAHHACCLTQSMLSSRWAGRSQIPGDTTDNRLS